MKHCYTHDVFVLKKCAQDMQVLVLRHITRPFLVCLIVKLSQEIWFLNTTRSHIHVRITTLTNQKLKNIIRGSVNLLRSEGLRNSTCY